MLPLIRIDPGTGNIGNQMFQYMLAIALQQHRPDAKIIGYNMPMWGLSGPGPVPARPISLSLATHRIPFADMAAMIRQHNDFEIVLKGVNFRHMAYRNHLALFRSIFRGETTEPSHGPNEIVINVRLGDIARAGHPNYIPLPLSFYHRVLTETGFKPIFMGQIGDDPYTQALREQFPSGKFLPSMGPIADFNFIRNAVNIVPAISTFSWLATWFSERAERIYFPIAGLYHPKQRSDIDLLPLHDRRYRFYQSDLGSWKLSDLPSLIERPYKFELATPAQLKRRFPHLGTDGCQRVPTRWSRFQDRYRRKRAQGLGIVAKAMQNSVYAKINHFGEGWRPRNHAYWPPVAVEPALLPGRKLTPPPPV